MGCMILAAHSKPSHLALHTPPYDPLPRLRFVQLNIAVGKLSSLCHAAYLPTIPDFPGKQGYIPESRKNSALSRILVYRSTSQRGRTFVRARAQDRRKTRAMSMRFSSLARTHAFFFFLEEGVAPQAFARVRDKVS